MSNHSEKVDVLIERTEHLLRELECIRERFEKPPVSVGLDEEFVRMGDVASAYSRILQFPHNAIDIHDLVRYGTKHD